MELEEIKREDLCQVRKGGRELSWRDAGLEQGTDLEDGDMKQLWKCNIKYKMGVEDSANPIGQDPWGRKRILQKISVSMGLNYN